MLKYSFRSKEDQSDQDNEHMQELLFDIINSNRCETKRELKNRKDIINKTLIRAIKRFFANSFRSMFPPKRFRWQYKRLKYLKETLSEFSGIYAWNLTQAELYVLLGYLLDTKNFSRTISKPAIEEVAEAKQFAAAFNKCSSTYSHADFEAVSSHRFFRELYLVFKNNKLENFLKSHEETSQNSNEYRAAIVSLELRLSKY